MDEEPNVWVVFSASKPTDQPNDQLTNKSTEAPINNIDHQTSTFGSIINSENHTDQKDIPELTSASIDINFIILYAFCTFILLLLILLIVVIFIKLKSFLKDSVLKRTPTFINPHPRLGL